MAIKVSKADVRPIIAASFPQYKGRKFAVEPAERVTLHDLNWGGGTRNEYVAVKFDGSSSKLVPAAPWIEYREGVTVELPQDTLIVQHIDFCGHDLGIRIYCHPSLAPKWLHADGEG